MKIITDKIENKNNKMKRLVQSPNNKKKNNKIYLPMYDVLASIV